MKVENSMFVYDERGEEQTDEVIVVKSHANKAKMVVIVVAGKEYVVSLLDLRVATLNITNAVSQ